ncbi:MAG: glutathione S-transferase C-terminal domain-containing protein [Pseudomonadota bacterium]
MGVMINGMYHADDPGPDTTLDGEFRRGQSSIRHWIGTGTFAPDPGRYHLYAAWNCPWAHRALLTRAVLGLQEQISVSYARPNRTENGWVFDTQGPYTDPELGVSALHEVYARQTPSYTGRLTVPVLWDRTTKQIVSNESADIIRMLAQEFDAGRRLIPDQHMEEIEAWNALIYPSFNNGVYRAGFARTQEAYDRAVTEVFDTLDKLDQHLSDNTTLVGHMLTEADIRLFPTLARFDVAYHYAFKCNIGKISDYKNLWDYARAIYAVPGVAETVDFMIYKHGYFSKSPLRNPLGIVPMGPVIDWTAPANRRIAF